MCRYRIRISIIAVSFGLRKQRDVHEHLHLHVLRWNRKRKKRRKKTHFFSIRTDQLFVFYCTVWFFSIWLGSETCPCNRNSIFRHQDAILKQQIYCFFVSDIVKFSTCYRFLFFFSSIFFPYFTFALMFLRIFTIKRRKLCYIYFCRKRYIY